jgi:hypothetical protein
MGQALKYHRSAMSQTLLRFGLWIVLAVLTLYVVRETFPESPFADIAGEQTLQYAGLFGLGLIAGGFVVGLLERAWTTARKNRCIVCGTSIPRGEVYCKGHLRQVLEKEREHDRRVRTR